MGFLDTILGRSKPAQPNLDELFSLPTAAITLEAAMNLKPTGTGSVCFRAAEGKAFGDIEKDVRELLSMGSGTDSVEVTCPVAGSKVECVTGNAVPVPAAPTVTEYSARPAAS